MLIQRNLSDIHDKGGYGFAPVQDVLPQRVYRLHRERAAAQAGEFLVAGAFHGDYVDSRKPFNALH